MTSVIRIEQVSIRSRGVLKVYKFTPLFEDILTLYVPAFEGRVVHNKPSSVCSTKELNTSSSEEFDLN